MTGQGRTGQDRSGQDRIGQDRIGQRRTGIHGREDRRIGCMLHRREHRSILWNTVTASLTHGPSPAVFTSHRTLSLSTCMRTAQWGSGGEFEGAGLPFV